MVKAWRRVAFSLAAIAGGGCSLILDFDGLQRGGAEAAGAAGAGQSAGAAGAGQSAGASSVGAAGSDPGGAGGGGVAGGAVCAANCDDGDPCTQDACDATTGRCSNEPRVLVSDGFADAIAVDRAEHIDLTAGGDRFYLSSFATVDGERDLRLYSLPIRGDALEEGPSLSEVRSEFDGLGGAQIALSGAGLVASDSVPFRLHAFVGIGAEGADPAQVWHFAFGSTLQALDAHAVSRYLDFPVDTPQGAPTAWALPGGGLYAAWPDAPSSAGVGGGMRLYGGPQLVDRVALQPDAAELGRATGNAVAFAPVGVAGTPGVYWINENQQQFVQLEGQLVATRLETGCTAGGAATFLGATSAFTGIEGLWWAANSTISAALPRAELSLLACGAGGCSEVTGCNGDTEFPTMANVQIEFARRRGDPSGVMYQIIAANLLDVEAAPTELTTVLSVLRIELDPDTLEEIASENLTPGGIVVERRAYDPEDVRRMPPRVAMLGEELLALAWIEPGRGGDEIRISRHRVCYPGG